MRLAVNTKDMTISVDGVGYSFNFQFFPQNLTSIQWGGSSGTMEFTTGPQTWFDNPALIQPYVDAYAAEAARVAAEAAAEAAAAAAANPPV